MRGTEYFANGLHESVANDDCNVTSRIAKVSTGNMADLPLSLLSERLEVFGTELVRRGTDVELKHASSGIGIRQGNVDTLFESGTVSVSRLSAYLLLMAGSSCQGMLVAPRTSTPVSSLPTPFI